MNLNPYLNAVAAAAYIGGIVLVIDNATRYVVTETIFVPMLILSLFVFSAAVMGYLFFFQPAVLFFNGKRKEAVTFFLKTVGTFAICILLFAALVFSFAPGEEAVVAEYVRENISLISPEHEVLGGTFTVTEMEVADGKGIVHYEDGHIALVADFSYSIVGDGNIKITSFTVRK